MRIKILIITFTFFIQGCTLVGIAIDSQFPLQEGDGESATQLGAKSDYEMLKAIIYDEPLPNDEPNKLTGCKELKGKEKIECYKVSDQLNKSLEKHVKQ